MIKQLFVLLFIPVILLSENSEISDNKFYDEKPNKITKEDLKTIKKFDDEIYKIVETKHKIISISRIYQHIQKHKNHKDDYFRPVINAMGRIGSKTKRANTELGDELYNDREYYNVYLSLKIPLLDRKTEMLLHNKKITYNARVLEVIEQYAFSYQEINSLKEEVMLYRLLQIRDKGLEKSGVKYMDERIETLKSLMIVRSKLRYKEQDLKGLKEELILMTTDPIGLMELL